MDKDYYKKQIITYMGNKRKVLNDIKDIIDIKIIIANGWLTIARNVKKVNNKKFFVNILFLSSLKRFKKKIKLNEDKKKVNI